MPGWDCSRSCGVRNQAAGDPTGGKIVCALQNQLVYELPFAIVAPSPSIRAVGKIAMQRWARGGLEHIFDALVAHGRIGAR